MPAGPGLEPGRGLELKSGRGESEAEGTVRLSEREAHTVPPRAGQVPIKALVEVLRQHTEALELRLEGSLEATLDAGVLGEGADL